MRVDTRNVVRLIELMAFLVATAAIAAHSPGHVSMDTSIQLYEAATNKSISWNPPFMSALMGWLGGGAVATAGLVWLNTVLIYGAYVITARAMGQFREGSSAARISIWRVVVAGMLILNPVIAMYVGIVWKDVLFAAFLTASAAFGISACVGSHRERWIAGLISILLLAPALLIRQQGIFMTPLLLFVPVLALSSTLRHPRRIALAAILIFVAAVLAFGSMANSKIKGNEGRSSSQGFRSIMVFDMIGIVNFSKRSAEEFSFPISEAQLLAVRSVYQPSRIDYIARNSLAEGWLSTLPQGELKQAWWLLVKQNPKAYIRHKLTAYATLLGLRGIEATQPVHIGVDGNVEYLKAASMTPGVDARDQFAYQISSIFFSWPIYRHAFWLVALGACAVALARTRLPRRLKWIGVVIALATLLFFLSYLPTAISSDFRYLFATIPLITLISLILILGAGANGEVVDSYAKGRK
jgi:hypothetical protein